MSDDEYNSDDDDKAKIILLFLKLIFKYDLFFTLNLATWTSWLTTNSQWITA
jgi:hypothetical protein